MPLRTYRTLVIIGGVDYNSGPYTVLVPAGVTSVPFDVQIIDDNIIEEEENFTLVIRNVSLPDLVIRGFSVTVTIVDNDGKWLYLMHTC